MRRAWGVVAVIAALAMAPLRSPAPAPAQTDPAVARMRADIAALTANGPREAGTQREVAAAHHVATVLHGIGLTTTSQDFPLPNGRTSANIATTFGSGPIRILLGAHLDSVPLSPGADDNGSGVAVLLELARRFDNGTVPVPLGTTVELVWFGAEERLAGMTANDHHFGSRSMAAGLAPSGALPHWMLSVDMVGYGSTPLAVWFDGADSIAAAVLSVAAGGTGIPTSMSPRGDISDHEAFARRGTPAALLWRPDNPGYHNAGDTTVLDGPLRDSLQTVEAFVAAVANPLVSNRATVHELYADLLVRGPDLAGAAWHTALIDTGRSSAGDLGASMLGSPEWGVYVAPVARLYLAALGRLPEHAGLVYWTSVLRVGVPLEAIAGLLASSPEFQARDGAPDDRGFIRLLYRNVLHRDADAAGESYWLARLAEGRSRAWLVVVFAESAEHRDRTAATLPVAVAYAGLLRREPDPAGLAWWSTQPLGSLVGGILGSTEYRARFGA